MLLKDKFLFFIILVLALTFVSMVSAQDQTTNTTTIQDGNMVDNCVSDLNTTNNSMSCDLNQSNIVDDTSFTHDFNVSTFKTNKNNKLDNENNNIKINNIAINPNNTVISDNIPFSSNIIMHKPISFNWNSAYISTQDELENALNNGGNYIITQDIFIDNIMKSTSSSVCIDGNGHTIYGKNNGYTDITIEKEITTFCNCIFDKVRIAVTSNVSFYNCTIQNTKTGTWNLGAAIYLNGCLITMNNCKIINCGSNDGFHGAVYLVYGWACINNTYFKDCYSTNSVSWGDEGGAIYSDLTSIELNNCTFENCYARDDGGAIMLWGDRLKNDNIVVNCSFINCHANSNSYGGAIYIVSKTHIINCNFTNCIATDYHENSWNGAIDRLHWFDEYCPIDIQNCVIDDDVYDWFDKGKNAWLDLDFKPYPNNIIENNNNITTVFKLNDNPQNITENYTKKLINDIKDTNRKIDWSFSDKEIVHPSWKFVVS